MAVPADLYD